MDILQQQDKEYIAGTYARFPLTIEGGKGSVVWDDAGKIYTDLSSGIAVNTFGIADDEWIKSITEQAGKIQHMSNLYYTEPCVKLAQMLCDRTGMKKVFFSNSGAEANECAIKAARKYAAEKHGADYLGVGAMFPTGSKADVQELPYETLKEICAAVSIPVVAIGGISQENVAKLAGSGICGVAVISAIYAAKNIKSAAEELKAAAEAMLRA